MSNQSVCDMVKDCAISGECDQAQPHDCGDYKCDTGTRFCDVHPESRCKPVEADTVTVKPTRVRKFKEDVIRENELLKMRVHQLEVALKGFQEMPTMRRIVWAVKGGAA